MFNHGDKVTKANSDYYLLGKIVATFTKNSGERRYVVEDERGTLLIHSDKTLVPRKELIDSDRFFVEVQESESCALFAYNGAELGSIDFIPELNYWAFFPSTVRGGFPAQVMLEIYAVLHRLNKNLT